MCENTSYGSAFLAHLRSISQQTYFRYKDLQSIKALSRDELALMLEERCPEFAKIIRHNSPEEAAELYKKRNDEIEAGKGSLAMAIAQGGGSIIDAIVALFSAIG